MHCAKRAARTRASIVAILLIAAAAGTRSVAAQEINPDTLRTLCNGCHRDKFEALPANPHSALDSEAWRADSGAALPCLACHGDVTQHVRSGGGQGDVFAFREEPASDKVQRCLGCHNDTHPSFAQSSHARAGLVCMDCHSQHASEPGAHAILATPAMASPNRRLGLETQVCFGCHAEIFAQFSLNEHHRLDEGAIECVSCHDPHAAQSRQLLGGFKQELCADCHADKAGPFVFEHGVSRVEGCTACHIPHGSQNRHLLTHQNVAELCLSCHAEVPQFHLGFISVGPSRFGLETRCTNCHSAIHGSNFHEFFLR